MLGNRGSLGGESGTLAHLLSQSVSHCQFMFLTLQQIVRMVLYLGCKGQRAVTTIKALNEYIGKPDGVAPLIADPSLLKLH